MMSITERSTDQKFFSTKKSSFESSGHITVFVDTITFDKFKSSIPGTKTKLEIQYGKEKAAIYLEFKNKTQSLSLQKLFKFDFKHDVELRLSLMKKTPLVSVPSSVVPSY